MGLTPRRDVVCTYEATTLMLFFKRILKPPEQAVIPAPRAERRSVPRYIVNPKFPIKAVLSFIGRDDSGAPMSNSRHGWNWKGKLIDCSERGVHIRMGPSVRVAARDLCDLRLTVEDFELTVPCHIANIREHPEGVVFGLKLDVKDETTWNAYCQLLEVLALGATIKLKSKSPSPDESGYFVEHYASTRTARLTIWRHPADRAVAAFEFQLKDNLVRAADGQAIEYFMAASGRPATAARAMEIHRLFSWVVPNITPAVPEDARAFLGHYAA